MCMCTYTDTVPKETPAHTHTHARTHTHIHTHTHTPSLDSAFPPPPHIYCLQSSNYNASTAVNYLFCFTLQPTIVKTWWKMWLEGMLLRWFVQQIFSSMRLSVLPTLCPISAKRSFYYYVATLAVLNLAQAVGSLLLYQRVNHSLWSVAFSLCLLLLKTNSLSENKHEHPATISSVGFCRYLNWHVSCCCWCCLVFCCCWYFIMPSGEFRLTPPGKTQQPQEQRYPFLSVCAAFSGVQTVIRLPVSGIFKACRDVDWRDCTGREVWRLTFSLWCWNIINGEPVPFWE